jgi:hypothetical protein
MVNNRDKLIVRELAKRYMELVMSEKQKLMRQRFCDTNDLKIVRPPVIIDEIPWYQMEVDGELTPLCSDEATRSV